MRPVANGSVSSNATVKHGRTSNSSGGGFECMGAVAGQQHPAIPRSSRSHTHGTLETALLPNLKSPTRSYQDIGSYNATLRIMDQGNTWSETDMSSVINVTDDTVPAPIITVNNLVITDNISILTNQNDTVFCI